MATDPVAEVGGVQYGTLKEAILAAPAAGTVTVLRDFTEYVTNDSDGKEITIDLDGHTWTATDGMAFGMTGKAVLYTTKKVTIKNGTITGGDTAEEMSNRAFGAITINSSVATVLDNVTLTGNKGCIVWQYMGTLTIQSSEINNNSGISSAGAEAYGLVGSCRGNVYIDKTIIKNNTGGLAPLGSMGTATTNRPATYSLIASTVENNTGSYAGAVYYRGTSGGININGTTIQNNKGDKAGAIYFQPFTTSLGINMYASTLITKNQGTGSESTGGIYLATGKASVSNSAVYKNKGSDFLLGNISAVLPAANSMKVNGSALESYYYEHGKEGDADYQKFDVGTEVPAGNYSPALSLVVTNGVVPDGVDDNGPWEYGDYRFVSLEKAVAAYNGDGGSEGEIKLLKDVEENATIATLGTTAKAAVIDLGTYTMKAADASKEVISVTGASNITVKGGTICNGLHGIRVAGNSTIVLDSLTVKDNASMGVVSYVGTSALNVSNCTFTNNGGKTNNDNAISWNGVLSVKNTQFTGNARGISSNMASTPLVFEGLTFSQNKGRALFVSLNRTDSATVSNCTFTENMLSSGNLVEISGSSKTVTIEDCTIENNSGAAKTVNLGAGLVATLKGCTISGNSAVDTNSAVGGVSASGAKVTLADTVIKNNKAENTGVSNIAIARIATGGVYTPGSSGTLTTSGSTAIYGNTATAANTTEVANDIYWDGATLNVAAAKDMVDGSFDFTDYVWDDLKGNPITTQLSGTTSSPKLLTAKSAGEVAYVAKIGEVGYKTLEEAFAAVKDGETIRVVIKETNPQATNLSASAITVNKDVTLDVNGVTVAGLGSTLFTVADSGKLTIKDSVADANSEIQRYNFADVVINQVGGIEGTIATTGSGKLTLASSMNTRNLTVKHNGAALVLDKPINPLKVSLGVDKSITFSDSWNAFAGTATAYSSPRITVTLDSAVLAALNDDNMDEPDVLIATGADSFIREYIKVEGITADHVRKVYIDSESPKKLVLRQYPLVGVYVDGVAGSDTDGNGSVGNPVKSFAKAKELLAQQANAEGIIVMNTLVVDENASWDLSEDGIGGSNKLIRFEEFSGNLVHVAPEATLSLSNIVFDGQGSEGVVAGKGYTPGDGSLIYVSPEGGLVLDSGAVLQNNYVQNRNGDTSCGGGVYSAGALTITDGRVSGNRAVQGAGIYQVGKVQGAETDYTGTLTMTGGSVDQNQAVYPSERIVIDPDTGQPHYSLMPAGGGIMLAFGAQMDFTGGSVTNNASNHIGGGISLGTTGNAYTTCLTASGTTMLNMAGNALIDGNTADMEGGGIYVQINAVADVRAGTISNNTARGLTPYFNPHTGQLAVSVSHGGGGIYVNGTSKAYYAAKISSSRTVPYTPGILKLYNAEISDNTAQAGGSAFAFCATGDAAIFELASSVVYNNHNADNIDIFMTGVDHLSGLQFEQQLDDITYYVSEYAMGGEAYKWQIVDTDGGGASTNAKKSDIQGNNKRLALTTSLANVADSLSKMKVRIVGNTSGMYGGGIGSNGTVINGSQAPVIDIKATKVWADNEQKVVQQPTSLKFKLERKKSTEGDEAYKEIDSAVVEAKDGKIEVVFEEQLLYADFVAPDSPENIEWVYRIVEDTDFRPTVSGSSVWAGPDNNGKAVADLYSAKTETKADTSRLASETYTVADTIMVKNFEITNTLKTGSLEVSKTLAGEGADRTKEFTFTVTLDASAYGADTKITGTYGGMEFKDNVATFTLKGGETKTATGLPVGVKYTVAEADYTADGYTTTSTSAAGTIEDGKTAKAAFTNTFKAQPITIALPVTKMVPQDAPGSSFVFRITGKEAKDTQGASIAVPMPEGGREVTLSAVEADGHGSVSFGNISFAQAGTYTYEVAEVPTNAAGWTYDETVYTVAYTVGVEGSQLQASSPAISDGAQNLGGVVFSNNYEYAPGTADGIVVTKKLDAAVQPSTEQTFTFLLEAQGATNAAGATIEAPMPASSLASVTGAGTAAFGTIKFEEAGTYTYKVSEVVPSPVPAGYTFDTAEFTVTYTVEDVDAELKVTSTEIKKGEAEASAVEFTNSFVAAPTTGTIEVEKTVEGTPEKPETFTFELAAEDAANPLPAATTITLAGEGKASFAPISFSAPGTYAYTVREVAGTNSVYVYDTSVYRVVFEVVEKDGSLVATKTATKAGQPAQTLAFTNSYVPKPSIPVDVKLVKHLIDALLHEEEFSFGLYDKQGNQYGEPVHTALGTRVDPSNMQSSSYVEIAFKDLVFTQPGTYEYTIREHVDGTTQVVEGDEWNLAGFEPGYYKGGVKYDDKDYPVVIKVTEVDGQLEAEVDYPTAEGNVHELVNEYSEEYIEIDGNDDHPNDGVHEPEPEPEPLKEDEPTPEPDKPAPMKTPAKASPAKAAPATKTGPVRTADTNPVAPLALVALAAAGTAGFAFTRRRKKE